MVRQNRVDTIRRLILETLHDYSIPFDGIKSHKDPANKTVYYHVKFWGKQDPGEVEWALSNLCDEYKLKAYWSKNEEDIYVIEATY